MSAAPARLELVPAAAAPGPPRHPAPGAMRPAADRSALAARARRLFFRCWLTGCAVLVLGTVMQPMLPDGLLIALLLCGALMMPACGIGLFCLALVGRSREGGLSLLLAGLSLMAAVSSLSTAHHVATEVYVSAHQPELDALAGDIRTAMTKARAELGPGPALDQRMTEAFSDRLAAAGVRTVQAVDGGLVFSGGPSNLVYGDGVPGPPPECLNQRLRALGGRWFERSCPRVGVDD